MNKSLLFILSFLFGKFVLSQTDSSEIIKYNLQNNINPDVTLASAGDKEISVREFLLSYEYGPAFLKRESNSKEKYLNFMIYEKLLALEGYNKGLDKAPDVISMLNEIEGDLASGQMYLDDIWNTINIADEEIETAAGKDQLEISLKWIFNKEEEKIRNIFIQLNKGAVFDSLFAQQFADTSVYYEDRTLQTTFFKIEKSNPQLAYIIDSMKSGDISPPIKTDDGWYIVKVDNLFKNLLPTESELDKLYYDVERALIKSRSDSLSDSYVNALLLKNKPIIIRESLKKALAFTAHNLISPEQYKEWDLEDNKAALSESKESILVKMEEGHFTLGEFFEWYKLKEPYIKLNLQSKQDFDASIQQMIWRMVRDKLLIREAFKRKYDQKEEVKLQMNWWKDKMVYSKMKLKLAEDIQIDKEKIKKYYMQNIYRYINEKGDTISFNDSENQVVNDYRNDEFTKKLVNTTLGLKNKHKIIIDNSLLEKIKVDIENDPRAVEVYTIKKGGTFIRQPYPVIDREWQFWR